ncbi:PAS domain S-box-containing protein/diguanylate cyclase (GGDEF)-like protein [Mycobacterium sp. BK558]|nr:PAS domain S-box-containing protein/diguanylate cyclase (GGDEF)-like protein [Mycobacterium sp. BK558]
MAAGLKIDDDAVAFVVQSASGEIIAATPQAQQILGLELDELLGRDSTDPRWAAIGADGVALRGQDHPSMRAMHSGQSVYGAIMGVHRPGHDAAGEHVWLTVDSVPLDFREGRPNRVVTRFAVITDARAAALQSAACGRLHRLLIDHAPDIAAWQLPDTTFLWVSSSSKDILGREPEEIIGRTAHELMHPDDVALMRNDLDAGAPSSRTVRMRHRDGCYRWLDVATQVIRDAAGEPAQLRSAWRDVTERVEAEQERDSAAQMIRSVWTSSPIGIAICTAGGIIEDANRAMCVMLGRPRRDVVGSTLHTFLHGDNHGLDAASPPAEEGPGPHHSECRYVRPDGTAFWGLRTTVKLDARIGREPGYLVHLQDVTLRRVAHEKLIHTASHDALTGLVNRTAFDEHVERTLKRLPPEACSGMLFIDIDDFKFVNDTYGHHVGDMLLQAVAARLERAIRESDLAARLGGDEFVVWLPTVDDPEEAVVVARRVASLLSAPYEVEHHMVEISVSVGVTTAAAEQRALLVRAADRAMYRAKSTKSAVATEKAEGEESRCRQPTSS